MFIQQDWLMRQIEMMVSTVAKVVFGKDSQESALSLEQERSVELSRKLTALLHKGQLGKAEDLLFFQLKSGDKAALASAIDFYRQANALTDEELEAQDFTRSELLDGFREAVEQYGLYVPGVWDEP